MVYYEGMKDDNFGDKNLEMWKSDFLNYNCFVQYSGYQICVVFDYWKWGLFKLRCDVRMKQILDFEDLVWKRKGKCFLNILY